MFQINEQTFFFTVQEYKERFFSTEPKSHSDLKICFVERGSAVWQIDGKMFNVKSGDIILLNDHQLRGFKSVEINVFKMFVLGITRKAFLSATHLSCFFNLSKQKTVIENERLAGILREIIKELDNKDIDYFEIIAAKLTEFFVLAQREYKTEISDSIKFDSQMVKILNFIDAKFTDNISLKQMAEFSNMTESSFSRYFSKCNGISFKKYLITKRISYATELLNEGKMSAVDIAYECGFSSISGFYDAFKKLVGTTPGKNLKI